MLRGLKKTRSISNSYGKSLLKDQNFILAAASASATIPAQPASVRRPRAARSFSSTRRRNVLAGGRGGTELGSLLPARSRSQHGTSAAAPSTACKNSVSLDE